MDPVTGAALIGAGASLVNTFGGLSSSSKNYKLQKKMFHWQKQVQQETWNREDNAVQRRAADLNAAGMNRLLAAGDGASSGAVVHVDSPQAPDYSHLGDAALQFIQTKMAMAKQSADVSQTNAQTKLLEGQLQTVTKQNELLQRTLDWYENHPESAPNVPGMGTANSSNAIYDLITRAGGRLGDMIGRHFRGSNRERISASEHLTRLDNYYQRQGKSPVEAREMARRTYSKLNQN